MRDPELAVRAQRASARLEAAWERWRAVHGLAATPPQPVVSYVGYSITEPWGEPRVVIGIDADAAEYLAEFLDRDGCDGGLTGESGLAGMVPSQLDRHPADHDEQLPGRDADPASASSALLGNPAGHGSPSEPSAISGGPAAASGGPAVTPGGTAVS